MQLGHVKLILSFRTPPLYSTPNQSSSLNVKLFIKCNLWGIYYPQSLGFWSCAWNGSTVCSQSTLVDISRCTSVHTKQVSVLECVHIGQKLVSVKAGPPHSRLLSLLHGDQLCVSLQLVNLQPSGLNICQHSSVTLRCNCRFVKVELHMLLLGTGTKNTWLDLGKHHGMA